MSQLLRITFSEITQFEKKKGRQGRGTLSYLYLRGV